MKFLRVVVLPSLVDMLWFVLAWAFFVVALADHARHEFGWAAAYAVMGATFLYEVLAEQHDLRRK